MALYCGIDLHSTNCWVTVLEGVDKVILDQRIENDLSEILKLLEPFGDELRDVAVESTYNWYWLVDGMSEAGYQLHLANTWAAGQYDGLKYADDRHDARWLAHMLALGLLPEGYICPKEDRMVRDLLRRRLFLVRHRTAFLLSLRGTIERVTGCRVSANDIKRWTGDNLEELIGHPVARSGVESFLSPVQVMSAEIKKLEKECLHHARKWEEYPYVRTVWGLGPVLGMTVLYETGSVRRFPSVGDYASYCRMVETERRSNNKRKGSGNAKNGNPHLSWAFSEAAHFAQRYYEPARRFYQRKRSRTKGIVAMRALAHKLARASYYVMRDKVVFDPELTFG